MKKFILILIFILFISATPDTENLNITVERKDDLTILVSWNVLFEEFDSINIDILHDGKIESFDIPLKQSSIELCCYENEVVVTINVALTNVVQLPDEECNAESCISFERKVFQNQAIVSAIPTTTTTSTTTTLRLSVSSTCGSRWHCLRRAPPAAACPCCRTPHPTSPVRALVAAMPGVACGARPGTRFSPMHQRMG